MKKEFKKIKTLLEDGYQMSLLKMANLKVLKNLQVMIKRLMGK